jgi:hypothetical protein
MIILFYTVNLDTPKTKIKGYQQHWYNALLQEATQEHDTKWLQQPAC